MTIEDYNCPACDETVPIEVEHWTDLITWEGECPACFVPLEMDNDTDAEDSMYFWLRRREVSSNEQENK